MKVVIACVLSLSAVSSGMLVGMAQIEGAQGVAPQQEVENNIKGEYTKLTLEAGGKGVKALVYPEFGLMKHSFERGASENCTHLAEYCDVVPPLGTAKCGGSTQTDKLSCLAGQAGLTLSVNACERDTNGEIWNVQLIFDKTGNFTHKYKKTHPFVHCFSAPATPEHVIVPVEDFIFGIFTCKDILYETPGVTLRHMGIDHFLYCADIAMVGEDTVSEWSKVHNATMVYSDMNNRQGGVLRRGERLTLKPPAGSLVITYDLQK